MSRPTLSQIAELLGVSTATVSLAMRGSPKISQKTRERVEAALKESGYVYQRSAAGLRTARTHTVGIVLNNISDPFYCTLLAAMEEALRNFGRTVFLCNSNESVDLQAKFIRTMTEYNADGIIVIPAIGSTVDDFRFRNVGPPPIVFVSRTIPGLGYDSVVSDDRQSVLLSMERLLQSGHSRIAVIGGDPSLHRFGDRVQAYKDALEGASIEFDEALVRPSAPSRQAGFEAAHWIAGLDPKPTAAICYNDAVALGLSSGLQRQGLLPGRNFAVIGTEDVEEASLVHPALSATTVSWKEMGAGAASLLVRRIEEPDSPARHIVLPSSLVVRETCTVSRELAFAD